MVSGPRIDFWYRTCLGVDSNSGLVTVALNGRVLEVDRKVGDLVENRPNSLQDRIVIGKWNRTSKGVDEQYPWAITNLQVFGWRADHDLALLSGQGCQEEGNYLAWQQMEWRASGEQVVVEEVAMEEVCRAERQERYSLAVPLEQTQAQSLATCRKLGHAWMVVQGDRRGFEEYIQWFDGVTKKSCKRLWTPYSDEEVKLEL